MLGKLCTWIIHNDSCWSSWTEGPLSPMAPQLGRWINKKVPSVFRSCPRLLDARSAGLRLAARFSRSTLKNPTGLVFDTTYICDQSALFMLLLFALFSTPQCACSVLIDMNEWDVRPSLFETSLEFIYRHDQEVSPNGPEMYVRHYNWWKNQQNKRKHTRTKHDIKNKQKKLVNNKLVSLWHSVRVTHHFNLI